MSFRPCHLSFRCSGSTVFTFALHAQNDQLCSNSSAFYIFQGNLSGMPNCGQLNIGLCTPRAYSDGSNSRTTSYGCSTELATENTTLKNWMVAGNLLLSHDNVPWVSSFMQSAKFFSNIASSSASFSLHFIFAKPFPGVFFLILRKCPIKN